MKTETFNPWPIIRWLVVALIYAGTVAIAVDQVRTKDRELVDANEKIANIKSGIKILSKQLTNVADRNAAMMDKTDQIKNGLLSVKGSLEEQLKDATKLKAFEELGPMLARRVEIQEHAKLLAGQLKDIEEEYAAASSPEMKAAAKTKDVALTKRVTDLTTEVSALDAKIRKKRVVAEFPRSNER